MSEFNRRKVLESSAGVAAAGVRARFASAGRIARLLVNLHSRR